MDALASPIWGYQIGVCQYEVTVAVMKIGWDRNGREGKGRLEEIKREEGKKGREKGRKRFDDRKF